MNEMDAEYGVVVGIEGLSARVSMEHKGLCEHCTAGTCDVSEEGSFVMALNEAGAEVGQRVRVRMVPYTYPKSMAMFYGLPAAALFLGAVAGARYLGDALAALDKEAGAVVGGFVAFGLAVLFVKSWAKSAEKQTEYKPVVDLIV